MKKPLKLLLHIASADRWLAASTNALNFLKAQQEDEKVEVVLLANGDAVTHCIQCDRELFDRLRQIVLDGGEIRICANALAAFSIPPKRLPEIFTVIPSGIRELVLLQGEGWAYVRP